MDYDPLDAARKNIEERWVEKYPGASIRWEWMKIYPTVECMEVTYGGQRIAFSSGNDFFQLVRDAEKATLAYYETQGVTSV